MNARVQIEEYNRHLQATNPDRRAAQSAIDAFLTWSTSFLTQL
jgi:hypothetical protein